MLGSGWLSCGAVPCRSGRDCFLNRNGVFVLDEKTVEQSMQLILHSGTGRSMAIEAVRELMKDGNVQAAKEKIAEAGKEIGEAHDIQTAMMSAECDGQPVEKSILLIHAQDHFMTALSVRDMAQLMVEMYEKLGVQEKGMVNEK